MKMIDVVAAGYVDRDDNLVVVLRVDDAVVADVVAAVPLEDVCVLFQTNHLRLRVFPHGRHFQRGGPSPLPVHQRL